MTSILLQSANFGSEDSNNNLSIVEAFPNLIFTRPVFLTHSNDNSNRIFVVEQSGRIKVFPNDSSISQVNIFINIEDKIGDSGGELGLLGLAFHPDYAHNGFFYVNYTAQSGDLLHTVISRFTVNSNNPNQANPDSEMKLLQFNQPFSNHNGGMIAFDSSGFLNVATGDGGSGGDPLNNAQNLSNLLGKILRIDVDRPSSDLNYSIPTDNPFVGNSQGFREEIIAWGLRNPWRFSIDPISKIKTNHGPGEFQVVWNGRNESGEQVASGLYFYQLKTKSFLQTHKMVLMK